MYILHSNKSSYFVLTADYGVIQYHIIYGGTYYAYTDITQFKLDIKSSPIDDIVTAAMKLKAAVAVAVPLSHPEDNELAFLYGVNFYSGSLGSSSSSLTIYADGQVSIWANGKYSCIHSTAYIRMRL